MVYYCAITAILAQSEMLAFVKSLIKCQFIKITVKNHPFSLFGLDSLEKETTCMK